MGCNISMIRLKREIIFVFSIIVFLSSIIVCRKIFSSYKILDVIYNHDFPINSFYNENGDRVYINDNSKYKVIFYLSDSCEACINRLDEIGKITRIFESDNIEYIILWEDKIPINKLKNSNIDIGICYSLKNQVSLSKLKPEEFILDKDNKVYYISSKERNQLVDVICTLDNFNNLKERVAKEIIISNLNKGIIDLDKDTLTFFSSDACESCKEAEILIYNNDIDKRFNIDCNCIYYIFCVNDNSKCS